MILQKSTLAVPVTFSLYFGKAFRVPLLQFPHLENKAVIVIYSFFQCATEAEYVT